MNANLKTQNRYLSWVVIPFFFPSLLAIAVTTRLLPRTSPARLPERNYSRVRVYLSGRIKQIMTDVWRTPSRENEFQDRQPDFLRQDNDPFKPVADDSLPFTIRRLHLN